MLDDHDHRNLGPKLGLFHLQEEAPGMAFWHPKGLALHRRLEEAVRRHVARQGFLEVRTPQLLRQRIWEKSGHWDNFAGNMFIQRGDGEEPCSALKPVSCPGHLQILQRMAPSHADLPIRLAEFGLVHRKEPSGTLHGLFRLRQFTQDDGHIFLREEQVEAEVAAFARSLQAFYGAFGFQQIAVGFSSRPALRAGSDEVWARAEAILSAAARSAGLDPVLQPGEGAFYGPKLEFSLQDRLGRAWQCGTIQLDLVLPERFGVHYVDADGARRRPAMLHRALLGSLERFLGILLEHHRGALPAWFAAEQIVVAPLSESVLAPARELAERMCGLGLRAVLDARAETLKKRVFESHKNGVPFVVAVGGRELASGSIAIRDAAGQRSLPLEAGLAELVERCRAPV
jgi:threonyl-tRNA synthetase